MVELRILLTVEEERLSLKRSINLFPMPLAMNIKMPANISLEKTIRRKVTSNVVLLDQWLDILNFLTNKSTNIIILDLSTERKTSWLDQLTNHSRRKFNMLKMHMKERKIWENWIIREELLWFLINLSHFQTQSSNMALLIVSEKPMVLTESSKKKSSQSILHQVSELSKLVTYQRKVTTKM